MAGRNLELIVDVQSGRVISSFDSTVQGSLPAFVFGDSTPISVRLVEPSKSSVRPWQEIDLAGQSVRIAIGTPGSVPLAGTFTLTYGANTTAALAYNATAAQVDTALNALASITSAGGVTVTATASAYKIVFDTVGERTAITADVSSLSPTSGAYISTVLAGAVDAQAIYLLRLEAMPAAYAELDGTLATAAINVATIREGDTGVSDIQSIDFDPVPYSGTYTLTIATQETVSLNYNATAAEIQAALGALGAITPANVSVKGEFPSFTVTFGTALGDVGAITGSISNLTVPTGRKGTLSNNTTGIAELLGSASRADATLEIEIVDDDTGATWTPLQVMCSVRQDVIPNNPGSSTGGPVYLLESVADDRYLTPAGTSTVTNKRVTNRVTTIVSSATPAINTDNCDAVTITAQAEEITSMTSSLSGTPVNFDRLIIRIKDDGTGRAITWGASFANRGATLLATTIATKTSRIELEYNSATSTWDCIKTITEA